MPSLLHHTQLFFLEAPLLVPELFVVCPLWIPPFPAVNFSPRSLLSGPGLASIFFFFLRALSLVRLYLLLFSRLVFCFTLCLLTTLIAPLIPVYLLTCFSYCRLPDYHCPLSRKTHKDLSTILAICLIRGTS